VYLSSATRADTTVLVGTFGPGGETLTGGIKSFAVTNSGSTWTQSHFNSDGWSQTITAGVGGLAQDIYGNVYAAVNTGDNNTRGIRIYRQTGGASVGYLNSTWGSGNLTGNSPDGLVIGPNGQLYAGIAFGTGNNKLLSFNTATLSSGQIQTGQGGTDTGLTGLSTPRGMTIASDGNFYIANRGTRQILRWTGSGTTASVLATNNSPQIDANYQGVSWDAGNNQLLTRSQTGAVGSLTLAGVGSDSSIRVGAFDTAGTGVANVEGQVAFTQGGVGKVATAVPGNTGTQTDRATGLTSPNFMLVLRDTRLWEGATGSWATGGNWRQGIGGTTGAATFTDGSGATPLPSVLTFTGAGGTATNDVSGTVNVGGLNFAPGAGAYTLAGSGFTLAPDANIRNLSTNAQTISADIVLAGDQWVQADPGSSLSISGGISGAAALRKLGSGTLTLSGNNTYSGNTTVSAGVLEIGSGGTTGSVVGNISNNGTLIFNRSDALTYSGTISGGGALTKIGSAVLTLSGSNTYSGNTTVSAGVLAISNTTALPGWNVAGRLAVASGAALAVGNSVNDAAVATLLSTGSNFQAGAAIGFDTTAGNRTYAAAIGNTAQGSLGLVKLGSDTLTLSGSNSYTGSTTISGGTLALGAAGSFANSSAIIVGSAGSAGAVLDLTAKTGGFSIGAGQLLGGGGTVRLASSGTLNVLGTFSPGNSPGLFTYDAGTTVLSGTTLMEIFGTSRATSPSHGSGFYDAVDIVNNGTLQFGGILTLEFSSLFANNTTFDLFTPAAGSSLAGNFTGVNVGGSFYTGLSWNQTGNTWKSSNTVGGQSLEFSSATGQLVIVPEPAGLALAGLGIAATAYAYRRRRS
jgi:autotransporter-associated beta strand protein